MTAPTLTHADPAPTLGMLDGLRHVVTVCAEHGHTVSISQIDTGGDTISLILRPWPTIPAALAILAALGINRPTRRDGTADSMRLTGRPAALGGTQLTLSAQR